MLFKTIQNFNEITMLLLKKKNETLTTFLAILIKF